MTHAYTPLLTRSRLFSPRLKMKKTGRIYRHIFYILQSLGVGWLMHKRGCNVILLFDLKKKKKVVVQGVIKSLPRRKKSPRFTIVALRVMHDTRYARVTYPGCEITCKLFSTYSI